MERTKRNRIPNAILCSDFHLREDTPACWVGDFDEEQWNSVLFVNRLQKKYDCLVIHAGDLFHHWKPSPYLLTRTMKYLSKRFYTIYGQHDLPQHNLDLSIKSGICTLEQAGLLTVLKGVHWGQEPSKEVDESYITNFFKRILVWHHLTYLTKPFPGAEGGMAEGILRKYPQYDLIVTGDNHQSFTINYKGRILVNPGSLTRQTADQIDFNPRVYLWYAEDNMVEPVYIPNINPNAISREHLDRVEKRDSRIEAFISQLDNDWDVGISFEQNLEEFRKKNNVKDSVMQIIYKSIEK